MKNKVEDLRNHLFETLEKVKDGDMDLDRAQSVCNVSQQIINSAKVEVDFIRATDRISDSGFLSNEKPALPQSNGKAIGNDQGRH